MIPDNVIITNELPSKLQSFLANHAYDKIGIIVDENTEVHCLPLIKEVIGEHWLLPISSGEHHKTLTTCEQLWQALTDLSFTRKDLIINLGGGVIGDMGGFVASTYKRGLDFINLPTTLLSQVDASIGGKLGVDFNGLKNHIGIFQNPSRVYVYPEFIKTLPERELHSGFAEVIKHGLIKDSNYWREIKSSPLNLLDWNAVIPKSIYLKGEVVSNDPFEKGERKILNFGHTLGHAIETFYLPTDQKLLHGEAIAVGMICEAFLSYKFSGLSKVELDEIAGYLINTYQPASIPTNSFEKILSLTSQDKKNVAGKVHYSLLKKIGQCGFDYVVPHQLVIDSLFYFNSLID